MSYVFPCNVPRSQRCREEQLLSFIVISRRRACERSVTAIACWLITNIICTCLIHSPSRLSDDVCLVRLGREQFLYAAYHAVAATLSLFQFFLEVEAHQILATYDADDTVGHVDDCEVSQPERTEDHVGAM